MKQFSDLLAEGWRLLIRSPGLALLSLAIMLAGSSLDFLLQGVASNVWRISNVLVFYPFFGGAILASFIQVHGSSNPSVMDFVMNGKRNFIKLLNVQIAIGFTVLVIGLLAFAFVTIGISIGSGSLHWENLWEALESRGFLKLAAVSLLIITIIPTILVPYVALISDLSPSSAVITGYRLALRNLLSLVPILVLFFVLPVLIVKVLRIIAGEMYVNGVELFSRFIGDGFLLVSIPVFILFVSERLDKTVSEAEGELVL